jgi:hypothetical protein
MISARAGAFALAPADVEPGQVAHGALAHREAEFDDRRVHLLR